MIKGEDMDKKCLSKFNERLKDLRQDKKLTQTELSELTGISQSMISAYELNQTRPTDYVIITFCKFFGVSADFILGLTDEI